MCKGATVLFVPSQPPRPGETLHFERSSVVDFESAKRTIHGTSRYVTDEVVRSVANDAIEELEVRFVEAHTHLDDTKPAIELTGTYVVHGDALGNATFTQDGQPPASEDVEKALRGWSRNDVGVQNTLLELLTDRTYVVGQEAHWPGESVTNVTGDKADARITLVEVTRGAATFSVDLMLRDKKSGIRFHRQGKAILDTQHARLRAIDYTSKMELPAAAAAKLRDNVEHHETFQYGHTAPESPPRLSNTCEAKTLRIARRPDVVGETYEIDQNVRADERFTNVKSAHATAFQFAVSTSTKSRIVREEGDRGETIEIAVLKEHIEPVDAHGVKGAEENHDGEQVSISTEPGGMRFTRNEAPVAVADIGLSALLDSEAAARWTARLATDRTYEVGVEQTFNHELIPVLGKSQIRVRALLSAVDGNVATFKLDMKAVTDGRTRFMRGELTMDVQKARPMSLHLKSEIVTPDVVAIDGDFTVDFKFRY